MACPTERTGLSVHSPAEQQQLLQLSSICQDVSHSFLELCSCFLPSRPIHAAPNLSRGISYIRSRCALVRQQGQLEDLVI